MKVYNWKLFEKSSNEYHIKEGRRIISRITRASEGWVIDRIILKKGIDLNEAIEFAVKFSLDMPFMTGMAKANLYNSKNKLIMEVFAW